MRKIQAVSIPRSGHSLLTNYLAKYFGRDVSIEPTFDNGILRAGPFIYCETYLHCRTTPCPDPAVNFQKSHDFGGAEVKPETDGNYVVQTRRALPAIISHYLLRVRYGRRDSQWSWSRFFRRDLREWSQFQQKWAPDANRNSLILTYEDLVQDAHARVQQVIEFAQPSQQVDQQWLNTVIASRPPFFRDKTREFKYFTAEYERLARVAEERSPTFSNPPASSPIAPPQAG